MRLQVAQYSLSDLQATNFDKLWQDWPFAPFSQARLESLRHLPFSVADDFTVLIVLKVGEEPAAFQAMLPDEITIGVNAYPFAWLCGKYVHPTFRRKGLSRKLNDVAYRVHDGLVGCAHLGPIPTRVLMADHRFYLHQTLSYTRYYLRPPVLDRNRAGGTFWRTFRRIGSGPWAGVVRTFLMQHEPASLIALPKVLPNLEESAFSTFAGWSPQKVQWVLQHPWMKKSAALATHYPFTDYVSHYAYFYYEKHPGIVRIKNRKMRFFPLTADPISLLETCELLKFASLQYCDILDMPYPSSICIYNWVPHKRVENSIFFSNKLRALLRGLVFSPAASDGLHV